MKTKKNFKPENVLFEKKSVEAKIFKKNLWQKMIKEKVWHSSLSQKGLPSDKKWRKRSVRTCGDEAEES